MGARVVSYAEPTVGAVTLAVKVADTDLAKIVADLDADRAGAQVRVAQWVRDQQPHLFDHEWAHVLQVAAYPLLYLRAARTGRLLSTWAKAVAQLPDPAELPVFGALGDRALMSAQVEVVRVRLTIEHDGIRMNASPSQRPRRGMLQELDLVEEDATVFQYRVEVGSRGTGHGYRRWLAERARYSALFSFLSTFATDDQALALLPVLVRISMRTLRPLESLAAILTDVVREGADVFVVDDPDEPWERRVEDLFTGRLLERVPPAPASEELFFGETIDDEQGFMDLAAFARLVDITPHLPLATLATWSREDSGLLDEVMRAPWRFIDRDGNRDARLERFTPPLALYVLTGEPSGYEVVLGIKSDAMRRTPAPAPLQVGDAPVMLSSIIDQMWRSKGVLDASLGRRAAVATCPHTGCRFHSKGLCEGWMPFPASADDCEFPPWMETLTGKTVSEDGTALIRRREPETETATTT